MSTETGKQGAGEVRHDLAPLTSRFSALGTPKEATWLSGELGSAAPGPTTYWSDAVVTVSPDTALDALFVAGEFRATSYLIADGATVVLVAKGYW